MNEKTSSGHVISAKKFWQSVQTTFFSEKNILYKRQELYEKKKT